MKYIFLGYLLLARTTFAFPAVGDYAYFTTTDGYSKEAEVLSFDSETKTYLAKYTDRIDGVIDEVEYRQLNNEGLTSSFVDIIILHCSDWYGGVSGSLSIPLGNFESCLYRDTDSGEKYYVGRVPFGILKGKLYASRGDMKEYTLQKYRLGN